MKTGGRSISLHIFMKGVFFLSKKRVILHAFQWKLSDIIKHLSSIKESGFNAIQISPIAPTKDEDSTEFWMLYQPARLTVGNKQIGSRDELIYLCSEARKYDIEIIADIVLRHLAGADDGSIRPHENDDPYIIHNPEYWLPVYVSYDYENRFNITNGCFGLPALNYFHHDIQDYYISYLDDLVDCGISSFRVDMGKHFALPEEGCDFWTRVIGRYSDQFNYAENLDCPRFIQDKYSKYIGIIGGETCTDKTKYVDHFETHDTYHTFRFTVGMTDQERLSSWKFILDRSVNALWFSRPYDQLTLSAELAEINNSSQLILV